jgi:phosphohistidine phosphatase
MRLYLVQHGEAHPEQIDPQRHLTDKGKRDVERVGQFLRPLKISVAAVWHSGKPRARQTAEILAAAVGCAAGAVLEREGLNPSDGIGATRRAVEESADDLMIVGHLPFLSKLAAALVTGEKSSEVVTFQYSGVVCLQRNDSEDWRIAWMIVPALLG